MAGRATLDVAADILGQCVALLPRTYRVIGSQEGREREVRLVVESDEIRPETTQLSCMVEDVGSTRTVTITQHRG